MRNAEKRPTFELADIIKIYGEKYRMKGGVPAHHLRTLSAIERCRTAELGGHINVCTDCGSSKISYNSCRNRHCPKCGGLARELWIEDRRSELLPVRYQHIVFTIPAEFNDFCRYDPSFCYGLLFRAAWKTLDTFAKDKKWLGANAGASMVLHTWGQNLMLAYLWGPYPTKRGRPRNSPLRRARRSRQLDLPEKGSRQSWLFIPRQGHEQSF